MKNLPKNTMRNLYFVYSLLIIVVLWTNGKATCPPGWKHFHKSCYSFTEVETSWINAEASCIRSGAHLVKIESFEENAFLRKYLNDNARPLYGYDMWLGGRVWHGEWSWVDETLMDPGAYSDWVSAGHTSVPLATQGMCLEFESAFGNHWSDDYCDELNFHICERPFDPLTPPPLTTTPATNATTPTDNSTNIATTNTATPAATDSVDGGHSTSPAEGTTTTKQPTTPVATTPPTTQPDTTTIIITTHPDPNTHVTGNDIAHSGTDVVHTTQSSDVQHTSADAVAGAQTNPSVAVIVG